MLKKEICRSRQKSLEGNIPVISGGREPAFYCDTFNREGGIITVAGSGAGAGYVQYWDTPIFANDCFTLRGVEQVDTKYLYYCLASIQGKISDTKKGGIGSTHAAGVVAPADRIKTCGREWTESLSKENKAAIHSYTGTAYSNINARLRGLEKSFDPGNQECAIRIHQALSGASIPADCTVYRGVSSKALGMLRMLPDNMLVGKTFTDHGFMSTSLERNSAFGGDMLLEVDVPKGAHGAYVGDISSAGHYESEVLFDAGQQMRITGVRCDENGRRIVSVRIMT